MKYFYFFYSLILLCSISSCQERDKSIEIELKKASNFLDSKNYNSSLNSYKTILKGNLKSDKKAKVMRNISIIFGFLNQQDSAIHYINLGIEAADKNSFYYFLNKAELCLLKEDVKNALSFFDKAKNKNNKSAEVYNSLSLIYAGSYGDKYIELNKALVNAKSAFKIVPSDIHLEQLASVYFQLEDFPKAQKHFKTLYEKHPEIKWYQFYYGQSMYFNNDEEKGIELMKEAAERDDECKALLEDLTS
jgi:tetratricopeptide (TPR) repeat protein